MAINEPRLRSYETTVKKLSDLEASLREARDGCLVDGPYLMALAAIEEALQSIWMAREVYSANPLVESHRE